MFVLILATLLFSVRGRNADTGASVEKRTRCQSGFCITLNEGETTAEAGLCVVIPCSFTTSYGFTPQNIIWYKCEQSKPRCVDSDMIFHTNKNNRKVQSGFKGRVSLLEPDVSQKNCSIIISDLTESDSGSYQLRVTGNNQHKMKDGFTFSPRATVSVTDLIQTPTVMVPPLTEGQQTTLTCTAPGLCSGSDPEITWLWRGPGQNDSHITGNITAFKTENLTAVTQRHSSTLMFNSSAEHHGTNVTCRVRFTNITTEETVTLNVTYVKGVKITGKTRVKEGETLNLTCSVESFPPSLITWTIYSDKYKQNGTETTQQNDTETYLQEESGIGTFSIANMTAEDSGQYTCTAKHLNNTLIQNVDVTVMYMKKPVITGNMIVKEGDALDLTCSVESFPLSHITWTVLGSNTHLRNGPETGLQNDTGSATLVIHNVTVEHSGQYICTAKHLDTTLTVNADITVTLFPKILNSSGCRNQSEVLTCMCISEGFPLPTIKWPLLKDHTEYSVITTVSKHTVNSTITLKANDHNSTVVQCVSSNEASREAKENFTIRINASEQEDQTSKLSKMVSWLKIIIAFLIGVLFSAALCSLAKKCQRKKLSSVNLDETLEMMTSQEDPLIDPCQALEDDQTYYQEAAEVGEDVTAEKAAPDLDGGAKDVEYASINFSVLKRKSPREATKKQETTETEYAEIKKQVKEDSKDDNREEGEVFEDKEEEAMIVEDEESKHCVSEDEDVAVYSNVKDIMESP